MNATARDFNSLPADTNGMEDLFICEPVRTSAAGCLAQVPTDADLYLEPIPTSAEPVPVENAAIALGYSLNALKKQLRKGTIRGFKQQTKHGEKWFVDPSEIPSIYEPVRTSADRCLAQVPTDADQCLEPVLTYAEPVPTNAEPVPVDKHFEVIKELQNKIEILTYRNGYLEAQLETEREQIKLLTDSQHKPGWWTKFMTWFMGSR